jgi:mannose-1-phosphate guanylyltransferase
MAILDTSGARRAAAHPGAMTRWAVVLAGGDGTRLLELTRGIAGDDRPKQFCAVLGEETLLDRTRRRVALGVSPRRTLFSLSRAHERYYAPLLRGIEPARVVVQPRNRGTAPAILYALLRVAAADSRGAVALFPSDHHVSDDRAFMAHAGAAFALVGARPGLVALLALTPDRPETEYGWIEPTEALEGPDGWPAYRVRRFWEKPAPAVARALLRAGGLWNSFVVVGRVATLLGLVGRALPGLAAAFAPLREALGTAAEAAAAEAVYGALAPADFSRGVLTPCAAHLAALPVRGLEWSDLGSPDRVLAARGQGVVRREDRASVLVGATAR